MNTFALLKFSAAAAVTLLPATAFAAGTNVGVEAGFSEIATNMTTILEGAGGYLIMILSVVIAGITLAFTGRWTFVAIAFGVALFLGYGVNTLAGIGGITGTIDLVAAPATIEGVVQALPQTSAM